MVPDKPLLPEAKAHDLWYEGLDRTEKNSRHMIDMIVTYCYTLEFLRVSWAKTFCIVLFWLRKMGFGKSIACFAC